MIIHAGDSKTFILALDQTDTAGVTTRVNLAAAGWDVDLEILTTAGQRLTPRVLFGLGSGIELAVDGLSAIATLPRGNTLMVGQFKAQARFTKGNESGSEAVDVTIRAV
jgi:hypothetical protein